MRSVDGFVTQEACRHQLSVDLELVSLAHNLRSAFDIQANLDLRGELEERVLLSTRRVLRMLERHHVRATFFVLGLLAERYPALVEEIATAGHRIASHGYSHTSLRTLGAEGFRRELARCRDLLQPWEEAWEHPHGPGFRAPDFSLPVEEDWPYRILAEEGFGWSSSVMRARVTRSTMGRLTSDVSRALRNTKPHLRIVGDRGMWEYPLQGFRVGALPLSWGGGFWLRALPRTWNLHHMQRWDRAGRSFHLYLHPWEMDADQPRLTLPVWRSVRQYRGLQSFERRLENILPRFSWRPAGPL